MALKYILNSETELPTEPALKALYVQTGDKWVLDVEGAVPKAQHDEFRNNNIALKKSLDAYGGADPTVVKDLMAKREEIEAAAGSQGDKVKDLVEKRVAAMRETFETEKAALQTSLQATRSKWEELAIDRTLVEEGTKLGLRATAHLDLVSRGRRIFKLADDGKLEAFDGETKVFGATGEPLSVQEWIAKQAKEAAHLFEPSTGGGGGGSGKPGTMGSGENPWKEGSWNLTQQSKLLKEDRARAQVLAAAAGVTISAG